MRDPDSSTAAARWEEALQAPRPLPSNGLGQPAHYRPPRSMILHRAGEPDQAVALDPGRDYRVGRGPVSNDLVFDADDTVSRVHGRLVFDGGVWRYADQRSANGSAVVPRSWLTDARALSHAPRLEPYLYRPVGAGEVITLAKGRSSIELTDEVLQPEPAARTRWPSAAGRALEQDIARMARTGEPVFLLGASGSGKTFVAGQIHARSKRAGGDYVVLNCGRLGSDVARIHSELLGHVKGAFTGALEARVGAIPAAHGGTLFLDEVESLTAEAQAFLLDVVERTGPLRPLGAPLSTAPLEADVRFISASKVPLARSGLRHDLCERLSALSVVVPALEDRREDIPMLVERILATERFSGNAPPRLTPGALELLQARHYPGQIRELAAAVRAAAHEAVLRAEDGGLPAAKACVTEEGLAAYFDARDRAHGRRAQTSLNVPVPALQRKRPADLTAEDLATALRDASGNQTHAAQALGVSLNTLKKKMRAFGLRKADFAR